MLAIKLILKDTIVYTIYIYTIYSIYSDKLIIQIPKHNVLIIEGACTMVSMPT